MINNTTYPNWMMNLSCIDKQKAEVRKKGVSVFGTINTVIKKSDLMKNAKPKNN